MKLNKDDPRLSAYVLGELDEEEERIIRKALNDPDNQEARWIVEEIQKTASRLTQTFGREVQQSPELSPGQKQALKQTAREKSHRGERRWFWGLGLATAGALAAVLVVSGHFGPYMKEKKLAEPAYPESVVARQPASHGKMGAKRTPAYRHRELKEFGLDKDGPSADPRFNTERYDPISENTFQSVAEHPLSTFSIDVDTASYANLRRFLNRGSWPPADAVRIEEMINYFDYAYPVPTGPHPFSVNLEVAGCLWAPRHRLVRIGLKGYELPPGKRPPSNLVFLLDVSGSMNSPHKLPLLKQAFSLLVENLGERDRVAMVVYAGAAGLVLPSTPGDRKKEILTSLGRLQAGGSTNGGAGIQLAYRTALEHFIEGGNNRVILATDGDFNVGTTGRGDLQSFIARQAKQGVSLTILGFGMGNYQDARLEYLADKGNGNYAYIDNLNEAKKVLVNDLTGTLFTIAKDVKIQVEFNPATVRAYRLVGYENRLLAKEDFNDDTKDAGEIGAGHTVTGLYQVVLAGEEIDLPGVDPLKYQKKPRTRPDPAHSGELLTVKLRYKRPDEDRSRLITRPLTDRQKSFARASRDFQFAASVAAFGMLLRDSKFKGSASYRQVQEIADANRGPDRFGYREEFVKLVESARSLSSR